MKVGRPKVHSIQTKNSSATQVSLQKFLFVFAHICGVNSKCCPNSCPNSSNQALSLGGVNVWVGLSLQATGPGFRLADWRDLRCARRDIATLVTNFGLRMRAGLDISPVSASQHSGDCNNRQPCYNTNRDKTDSVEEPTGWIAFNKCS